MIFPSHYLYPQEGMSELGPKMAEQMYPTIFLKELESRQTHSDGRPLRHTSDLIKDAKGCMRSVHCSEGELRGAAASCMARIGGTAVLCGLSLETAPTAYKKPDEGFFVCNLDVSSLVSSDYKMGPPTDEVQTMNAQLNAIVSPHVPLEKLLIEREKSAFVLYADVLCLSDDGSVLDAAVLATLGALKKLVLPNVHWDKRSRKPICKEPPEAWTNSSASMKDGETALLTPNEIEQFPAVLTLASTSEYLFPDPTKFEETTAPSHIIIGVKPNHTVSFLSQVGKQLDDHLDTIKACVELASIRRSEWATQLGF